MSKPVTPEEVKEFYRLYEKHGSFSEVARITGWSASTIGKYIRTVGMTKAHRHAVGQTITKKMIIERAVEAAQSPIEWGD